MRNRTRSLILRYGLALVGIVVATLLRLLLDPWLDTRFPFATLFFAVLVAAWHGGFGPGLTATLFGGLLAARFLLAPRESFLVEGQENVGGIILYLAVSFGIAVLGGAMRNSTKQAELARKLESLHREKLHVTLKSIGDAVIAVDRAGRVTFLNPMAQTLTGWSLERARGQLLDTIFQIVNEATREPVENPVVKVLRLGQVVGLANHTILIAKDGTERPIDDSAAPILDAFGSIIGVVLVFRDVADRRQAEVDLRRSEQELNDFFDTATIGLHWVGPDGIILRANQAELDLLGYPREEYVGRHIAEFHCDADVIADILRRLSGGERLRDYPAQMRCKDGSIRDVMIHSSVLREEGRFIHTRCFTRDVTEHKRAVDQIRFQSQLLDAVGQAAIATDPAGKIIYWNRHAESLYGWSKTEALGRNVLELVVAPTSAEQGAEMMTRLQAGESWSGEFQARRRDGVSFPAFVTDTPILDDERGVQAIIGISTDISERKRVEESLRLLADASATLAAVVDYQSTLQKVAGLAVPNFADWCTVDMLEADGSVRRLAAVHVDPAKIKLAHEVRRRYPPDPGSARHGTSLVLRTGKSDLVPEITEEMLVRLTADDEHLKMMRELGLKSYMCVPLQARGKLLGVVSFITAESARRYTNDDLAFAEELARRAAIAIENAQLYAQLREADRLKDEFLAMLAHELRNPLAPIRNALHIMRQPGATAPVIGQVRDMAERQVQHMARLLDDLLDVSRISRGMIELRRERVNLAGIVQRTVEAVRPLIDERRHELTASLIETPFAVEGDPTRIEQILTNLLTNACKYTDPGGRIWLTLAQEGNDIVVRVRDTGIGIAPDMLPKIFDLFVQAERRMDRSQGGVGIGLTLVRRLVELHGGSIDASSPGLGRGSEFVIRLPAAGEPVEESARLERPADSTELGRRKVLIVDDNQDAANSLAMLLRLSGQDVRTAYDGPTALTLVKDFSPTLVLLDIGMPGMDGYEVARRLRSEPSCQGLVLVALTGWGQEDDRRRSASAGFDHHFVKPVEPDALKLLLDTMR